jgi:hypothetical protein
VASSCGPDWASEAKARRRAGEGGDHDRREGSKAGVVVYEAKGPRHDLMVPISLLDWVYSSANSVARETRSSFDSVVVQPTLLGPSPETTRKACTNNRNPSKHGESKCKTDSQSNHEEVIPP